MRLLLLLGALGGGAGPLLAQVPLAVRLDTTAAAPVRVPVPAAVLAACQRVAPEILASSAVEWELGSSDYTVFTQRTLPIRGTADTLRYLMHASADSKGQVWSFDKEASANSLPLRVRWALQYQIRRYHLPNHTVLVVKSTFPHPRRPSHRERYSIWLHCPGGDDPFCWFEFWRNGRSVKQPRFR